jgi:hypothetical protein
MTIERRLQALEEAARRQPSADTDSISRLRLELLNHPELHDLLRAAEFAEQAGDGEQAAALRQQFDAEAAAVAASIGVAFTQ